MKKLWIAFVLILINVIPATSQTTVAPGDPAAQQISRFYAALTDAMKQGRALGAQGRYRKLEPVVQQVFDLPTMTRLTVGTAWSTIAPRDQQALIAAFTRMTVANYAKNFDTYSGEQFVVDPAVQTKGVDKLVSSKLIGANKSVTPFVYRMRQTGGAWKVVDVFLNGYVSELATRRSDFASTVASGGAPALVAKINALADGLLKQG
ncbi:MAG TPA: ABC transporter substrate-binding protein [Rhizomicrobium sp.]|jgi:phospholipid transport system substrate-binding protein|nr:ABC transporter substrate-binding protein [Rhizomicrobium sp.]